LVDDDLEKAFEAFGVTPENPDEMLPDASDDYEVWEENWETLLVFLEGQTQWRKEYAGMGGQLVWHGLRYGEIEVLIRLMGLEEKAQSIFEGIRLMERTALPILNKPKKG